MNNIFLTIMGKRWRFIRPRKIVHNGEEVHGLCTNPKEPNKTISVARDLSGPKEFEVVVHEIIHASDWRLDEEFVTEMAADLTRALIRLGYTKGGKS